MSHLDEARDVREGEELDATAIDAWLRSHVEVKGAPEVQQFKKGASNLTYLLRYAERELVLRRPPFGTKAKSAHDMGREVRVLRALAGRYPVPEVLAFCEDEGIAGAQFYVMERLRGVILRQEMPEGLLDEAGTRALCENVVDKLVELHSLDVEGTPLAELGKGAGYVRRQIEGWSGRFRKARTEDAPDLEGVMGWLEAHMPEDVATCVVHGDYRFDNVVLDDKDPLRIIGVLDWEMCTLGDPLMDLGNSLAYWVQADDEIQMQIMRRQPTHAPGMLTRDEVIARYGERTGRDVAHVDYYLVYGLFRLAVIIQQIYYRYFHGQTKDPRFAGFNDVVAYLEQRIERILA